jgi:hypothetical protein
MSVAMLAGDAMEVGVVVSGAMLPKKEELSEAGTTG